MKQPSDFELEKLLRDSIREMVESADPPPLEQSWARFEKKLKEEQAMMSQAVKSKALFPFRLAVAAGIIVLITGTLSFSFPTISKALGAKIVNIAEYLNSSTHMIISTDYKHNEQRPDPPGEEIREVEIEGDNH